jgi:serine/threonine-protein kinase
MAGPPSPHFDSSAPFISPRPGDVLAGKYKVESTLGSGGMGMVVLVEHMELGQRMAIKLMTPGVSHDPQSITRFLREARAAAGIHSEHVVRIFDVGTLDVGSPYMVMELLRGEDLAQLLTTVDRLPIHEAVDYVLQACHAIAEAHAMGIVHRDLKPSNLFLTRRSDGTALVKVLDFGISKAMNPEKDGQFAANLTATSAIMGSPLYMSPEQVRNAKQVDARADIWSLGVILHELLTGTPAFNADTLPGICAAIIADDVPPLRSLRPEAPVELEAIVAKCLEKSVNSRFQTVRELMAALKSFASTDLRLGSKSVASTMQSNKNPKVEGAEPSSRRSRSRDRSTDAPPSPGAKAPSGRRAVPASVFERSAAPVASTPTMRPPGTARGNGRTIAIAAAVIAAAGAVAVVALRRPAPPQPAAEVKEAPAQRKSFTLYIDSTPNGATVFEGDTELGKTPLQISVDNDAARKDLRRLTIRRDGFQPYSILQGPSDDNVRVSAPLVEVPSEPTAKPHVPAPVATHAPKAVKPAPEPAAPTPPPAAPTPAPTSKPDDIRLQR